MATKCYWPTYTIINPDFQDARSRYQHQETLQVDGKNFNIFTWLNEVSVPDYNKTPDIGDIGINPEWIKKFGICCDSLDDKNLIIINNQDQLSKISDALGGQAKILVKDFENIGVVPDGQQPNGWSDNFRCLFCIALDKNFPGLIRKFSVKKNEADDYDPKKHRDSGPGVFNVPICRKINFKEIILKNNANYTFTSSVTKKRIGPTNLKEYCPCEEFDAIADPNDTQRLYFISMCSDQDKPKDDQPPEGDVEIPPPITPVAIPEEDPLIPTEEQSDLPVEQLFTIKLRRQSHTDPCSKTNTETIISTDVEQKDYMPFVDQETFKTSLIKSLFGDPVTLNNLEGELRAKQNELAGLERPGAVEADDPETYKDNLEKRIADLESQIEQHKIKYAGSDEIKLNLKTNIKKLLNKKESISIIDKIITDKSLIKIGTIIKFDYLTNTPIKLDGKPVEDPLLLDDKFYKPSVTTYGGQNPIKGSSEKLYNKYPKYLNVKFLKHKIDKGTVDLNPTGTSIISPVFLSKLNVLNINTEDLNNLNLININENTTTIAIKQFAVLVPSEEITIPLGEIPVKVRMNIGFKGKFKFKLNCLNANETKPNPDICKQINQLDITDIDGKIIEKTKQLDVDDVVSTKEFLIKIPYSLSYALHKDQTNNIKDRKELPNTKYIKYYNPSISAKDPIDPDTRDAIFNTLQFVVSRINSNPEDYPPAYRSAISQFLTESQLNSALLKDIIAFNSLEQQLFVPANTRTIFGLSHQNTPGNFENGLIKIVYEENLKDRFNIIANRIGPILGIKTVNDKKLYFEQILSILNKEIFNNNNIKKRNINMILGDDNVNYAILEIEGNDNYNIFNNLKDDLAARINSYIFTQNSQPINDANEKPIKISDFLLKDPNNVVITPNRKIGAEIPLYGTYILDDSENFDDRILDSVFNRNAIIDNILDESSAMNNNIITNITKILETQIKLPEKIIIGGKETNINCCCCKYILDIASDEDLKWTINASIVE